jgi:hypothetical protein
MIRTRKIVLWIAVVALFLGGSTAILPSFLSQGHADYASVVSIKENSDYQDPALLKKAWALPVAATYRADIDFQRNASVCGPTSLVNVLHSLKMPGNQESILQGTNFATVLATYPKGSLSISSRISPDRSCTEKSRCCAIWI